MRCQGVFVGYTQEELEADFAGWIGAAAEKMNVTREALLKRMKDYYDGFCFDGVTRLSSSTLVKILAPVVVNPLEVSKNASIKLGIEPEKTNGKAPKADKSIQDNETIINPSFS